MASQSSPNNPLTAPRDDAMRGLPETQLEPGLEADGATSDPGTAAGGALAKQTPDIEHDGNSSFESTDDDNDQDGNDEYEDIDANEFDLMLSKSVGSAGGILPLEPESMEYSMLRNTRRRSRVRTRRGSTSTGVRSQSGRREGRESNPTFPLSPSTTTRSRQHRRPSGRDEAFGREDSGVPAEGPLDEETPLLLSSSISHERRGRGRISDLHPDPGAPSASSSSTNDNDDIDAKPTTTTPLPTPFLSGVSSARFWLIFLGIMTTYFVACFDSTIMASSHPVITSYFGSSNSASWLSTAFLLTSTSFQPLLGGVSDAVGRKQPYVATMAIFLAATLWCALAQSMASFILARAVCGLGAGGMMTLGSIMVSDLVPIEIRGAYQSYINITFGVGAMLGAGLGGAMADYLGWRWEFGIQVPLLALSLGVAVMTVPADLGLYGRERQGFWQAMKTFDFLGSGLMSTSVTFLILGLSLGGNVLPWSHPFVIASLVIFVVFFPLFLYVETIAVKPIMPIHLVRQSPHRNLIFSNAIAAFLSNAILFNVPLFFQGVLLTSATTSGLRLIICSAVSSTTGTATGFLITRTRRLKWPLVLGTALVFVGTLCLSSMQRSGWPTYLYLLCLVPASAGTGFHFPGTFMALLAVAEQRTQAVVTSTLILWRSLGMVLGVACSSLVVQNALWYYLDVFVKGEEKEGVIEVVRGSVEAIRGLEDGYRDQVVQSYAAALKVTFVCCSLLALLSFLIVLPVRLPRLGSRK